MINTFKETIEKYNLIEDKDRILLGISGGADSTSLLYNLLELRKKVDFQLGLCHLNHDVRGNDAHRDEEFVVSLAEKFDLPVYTKTANMDEYAKKHGMSKEEAGRKLRRDFFEEIMEKYSYNKLALAHNYNDQVETILMRILRGTGLTGLVGIKFRSSYIIRPLLGTRRDEIETYLQENEISYVEDYTNYENIYHRNKIRNVLLPELKKNYSANIDEHLVRLSELASVDNEFLDLESLKAYEKAQDYRSDKEVHLNIPKLMRLHRAVLSRVFRKVFDDLKGSINDISYENIKEIIELMSLDSGKYINNIDGIKIRKSYDKLIFSLIENKDKNNLFREIKLGINIIDENLSLNVNYTNTLEDENENIIFISKNMIKGNLYLRNRQNGDRIRARGLKGSKKLKDIFIDKKIDREKRDKYLILSDEEKVFWIVGLRKAETISDEGYIKIEIIGGNQWKMI